MCRLVKTNYGSQFSYREQDSPVRRYWQHRGLRQYFRKYWYARACNPWRSVRTVKTDWRPFLCSIFIYQVNMEERNDGYIEYQWLWNWVKVVFISLQRKMGYELKVKPLCPLSLGFFIFNKPMVIHIEHLFFRCYIYSKETSTNKNKIYTTTHKLSIHR